MRSLAKWGKLPVVLGVIALALAISVVSPAIGGSGGGKNLKKLVKKEVARQIGKATGPPGTARAFAYVHDQVLDSGRSKNIAGFQRLSQGIYCVTLPSSVDVSTVVPSVTPDFSKSPHGALFANFASSPGCPPNSLKVVTGRFEVPNSTTQGTEIQITFQDEAFTVLVP